MIKGKAFSRIYADYFMASRLGVYYDILKKAISRGYVFMTVLDYMLYQKKGKSLPEKVIINRHDIDTDLVTAKKIFNIEVELGVRSTFYFRIKTLDFKLMQDIYRWSGEASYHYEELDKNILLSNISHIRSNFIKNFKYIEDNVGYKLYTVASHGDFINRKTGVPNKLILEDENTRKKCGIIGEVYDKSIINSLDIYISDKQYPKYYYPISPFDAMGKQKIICLLTHPRHWSVNWCDTTRENITRMYEGGKYYFVRKCVSLLN